MKLLLIVFAYLISLNAKATIVEILFSEQNTERRAPFDGLYDYSQFGVIYYDHEIIEAGNKEGVDLSRGGLITSMFFQYAGWTRGYTAHNQTVKMGL